MDKLIELEEKLTTNIDLLEISRSYCEFNYDKSNELLVLYSMLDVIIHNQRDAMKVLDCIATS